MKVVKFNYRKKSHGVARTRLLDAKQGRLCHFFNESTNDSIKITIRDFGAINEKSYIHYVSRAIMYSIFSCFARAKLEYGSVCDARKVFFYLWRCRESNISLQLNWFNEIYCTTSFRFLCLNGRLI